jgi:hypothetical protein
MDDGPGRDSRQACTRPWLYAGLVEAALPAMHAALSTRINKTDRNDALGIAQMMRVGLFKPVHVKTPASQQRRLLLTSCKLLQRKVYVIDNDLRGQLPTGHLKVAIVGAVGHRYDRRTVTLLRSPKNRRWSWGGLAPAPRTAPGRQPRSHPHHRTALRSCRCKRSGHPHPAPSFRCERLRG